MARLGRAQPFPPNFKLFIVGTASIVLTGTITASTTEADIVAGGKTIILTVTGDTWVDAGTPFNDQRQNIINGMTSAQSEAFGWNNIVKGLQGVAGVVRTSDSVVTITLDAQITYNITANETVTITVPATALKLGSAIVAAPTFIVSFTGAEVFFEYMTDAITWGIKSQTAAGMGGVLIQ